VQTGDYATPPRSKANVFRTQSKLQGEDEGLEASLDRSLQGCIVLSEMENLDTPQYKLPPELLRAAKEADDVIRKAVEHVEGAYLVHRQIEILRIEDAQGFAKVSASELLRFISPLTRSIALDSADNRPMPQRGISLSGAVGRNILRFVEQFFDQLRDIICKGRKDTLSTTSHSAIAALALWLSSHAGIEAHLATAVATAILIAILTATKGAFCKMTAPEAKKALAKASSSN